MSSAEGDVVSLIASSLIWFSCASSSIYPAISPAPLSTLQKAYTSVPFVPLLSTGDGSTEEG